MDNENHEIQIQSQNVHEKIKSTDQYDEYQKVLGLIWDSKKDLFRFSVELKFDPKRKREKSNLCEKIDANKFSELCFTKRVILSQVNSIFDPLGLAVPFTVKAKILMRKLWIHDPKLHWDDEIPPSLKTEWISFFTELLEMRYVTFNRCIRPIGAKERDPTLIIFSDGSEAAYGCCSYLRWEMENGEFESRLVIAKTRIAPQKE